MKILVTNDDGVGSPGIWALARALQPLGAVTVMAPHRNMSGCSAATLHTQPICFEPAVPPDDALAAVPAFAVDGTPAGCVVLGLREFTGPDTTLVVSGINDCFNLSQDVLFSGTVGAALVAHLHGPPALAVSLGSTDGKARHWESAATVAAALATRVAEWRALGVVLNVNVPDLPLERIAGWQATTLAPSSYVKTMYARRDGRGENGRRIGFSLTVPVEGAPGTDVWAHSHGYVSITPIHADLSGGQAPATAMRHLDELGTELFGRIGDGGVAIPRRP